MDGWDWEDIDVWAGEWWLLTIAILAAAVALAAGYLLGKNAEHKRMIREGWQHPGLGLGSHEYPTGD